MNYHPAVKQHFKPEGGRDLIKELTDALHAGANTLNALTSMIEHGESPAAYESVVVNVEQLMRETEDLAKATEEFVLGREQKQNLPEAKWFHNSQALVQA